MAATAKQVERLRRMIAETTEDTYTDADIAEYIERYPCLDEEGEEPYTWDTSTTPPSVDDNEDWIPTYDLNAAAADFWLEKAALVAPNYDFSADGGNYSRSQGYAQAMQMARFYRSRRKPGTIKLQKWPEESESGKSPSWIGNTAEAD